MDKVLGIVGHNSSSNLSYNDVTATSHMRFKNINPGAGHFWLSDPSYGHKVWLCKTWVWI